ncbi:MAG: hypothetical protein WBB37_11920 [bacterium]
MNKYHTLHTALLIILCLLIIGIYVKIEKINQQTSDIINILKASSPSNFDINKVQRPK